MEDMLLPSPFEDIEGIAGSGKDQKEARASIQKPILPHGEELNDIQLHGTTTLSFKFSGGIIVAADSRASMGQYVSSRTVKKILPVSKHIIATMAGGAADCTQFIRMTAANMRILEMNMGLEPRVRTVAKLFASQMRNNRGSNLSVGTMMSGYDEIEGFSIYYLDSEGTCVEGDVFCVGSGQALAYAVVDGALKKCRGIVDGVNNDDYEVDVDKDDGVYGLRLNRNKNEEECVEMSVDKAVEVAVQAIRQATYRDSYSGGYINVFHIDEHGARHVYREDSRKVPLGQGRRS